MKDSNGKEYEPRDGIVFNGISRFYKERIVCPDCGGICDAEIEVSDSCFPFRAKIHDCEYCGCIIVEQDWQKAE